MTLGALLADDLLGWLDGATDGLPRRTLLWLDPEAQFTRLLGHVDAALAACGACLLRHDRAAGMGQLGLKLALLQLEAEGDGRAVVYLPGFPRDALEPRPDGSPPALWGVFEYRYKGAVWGRMSPWRPGTAPEPPTLLTWLRRHGLELVDAESAATLSSGRADAPLARYAELVHGLTPDRWPRPLRASDVTTALGGDPRDRLRGLLAAPANEVRRWGIDRPLVLQRLAAECGLVSHEGDRRGPTAEHTEVQVGADAEALADGVAVQLALAEAWDAFGRPDDFPFLSRLPVDGSLRDQQVRFLREDVLSHAELGPRFVERMRRLESSCDLSAWAADRPGQPAGLPLLARRRWRRTLEGLATAMAQGWKEARAWLIERREAIAAGASGPGDRLDREVRWGLLAELTALAESAAAALHTAAAMSDAAELTAAYVERWWKIDRLHLRVRAACVAGGGPEDVRSLADRCYFEYVAGTAERLGACVAAAGAWPPAGPAGVEALRGILWQVTPGRRAIIITDALRWDLACGVEAALGGERSLEPVYSTLPSVTPFGMSAMLPLDGVPLAIDFDAGTIKTAGMDLATREGRRQFLSNRFRAEDGSAAVEFMDLAVLLRGGAVPAVPLVVVFDNAIDEQGHKGAGAFPGLVDQFAAGIARAIERLHEAGVDTVHAITDHGFLLLPPDAVDALGRPEVLPAQALEKDPRWAALKHDAPAADVLRLALPLAPGQGMLGLPHGVRTLVKASEYLHGGISLQECVIPHLISRRTVERARIGLDLQVTTSQLTSGVVPVVLRPAFDRRQTPLGGLEPLPVRLWVETVPEPGAAARRVSDEQTVVLRPDVDELKPALYLNEGAGIPAGQRLRLQALDADSGRDLGALDLTLLVDWE